MKMTVYPSKGSGGSDQNVTPAYLCISEYYQHHHEQQPDRANGVGVEDSLLDANGCISRDRLERSTL